MRSDEFDAMHAHYETGLEQTRLDQGAGIVEFERTKEIIGRHLPGPPSTVADVGGGPGRYAQWLARRGYSVRHRDIVPLHVEQLQDAAAGLDIETAVGDATDLDIADESVDAVLLLGPLYHLPRRSERVRALGEARRIVRIGGPVFVAAISRWSARVCGTLSDRMYREFPVIHDLLPVVERSGVMPALFPGNFSGFGHRPGQLAREVRGAGLELVDLVAVEGATAMLNDLTERMHDPVDAQVVLDTARALERVPELLGVGPHLLATARRSDR